ncbi:MAG TPA: hypothetical protein VGQ42_15135 [Candidatus Dormibacteraeota bacterium]|jgi:hypothetical protein|nr:hypothetical protein [Candidatus Dormibacteraeota bacterium]
MLSLAGCNASANTAQEILTPDQARQVAMTWLHTGFATMVSQERGSLLRIDRAANLLRTSPAPAPDTRPHDLTIWMPHQGQYPLTFLCLDSVRAAGQPVLPQMYRFSRADAQATWTVTHQVALQSAASRPAVALDSAGYAQTVAGGQYDKFLVSPARLAGDYAAYLNRANSADSHEFAPGVLTSSGIENIRKLIADAAAQQHGALTVTFTPSDDAVDVYLLHDGGALVLFGLTMTNHVVATAGSITVTEDGKGVSGPAPGRYRDLTTTHLVLDAFTVPPKGSTAKVAGLGAYFGPVSTTATPG